jgi:CRP-like cAMP-binding protein
MNLLDFFQQKISLSPENAKTINEMFNHQEYPKGTIFLKPDNSSKRLIFLEKGLYRTFYYNEEKDITHFFWDENTFNTPIESVMFDQIAPYGWQAIETCVVRSVDYKEFQNVVSDNNELLNLMLSITTEMTSYFTKRGLTLNFKTAEEKYQHFVDDYPNIINRVPLGYLASYIGMTPQTLSVLRSKP